MKNTIQKIQEEIQQNNKYDYVIIDTSKVEHALLDEFKGDKSTHDVLNEYLKNTKYLFGMTREILNDCGTIVIAANEDLVIPWRHNKSNDKNLVTKCEYEAASLIANAMSVPLLDKNGAHYIEVAGQIIGIRWNLKDVPLIEMIRTVNNDMPILGDENADILVYVVGEQYHIKGFVEKETILTQMKQVGSQKMSKIDKFVPFETLLKMNWKYKPDTMFNIVFYLTQYGMETGLHVIYKTETQNRGLTFFSDCPCKISKIIIDTITRYHDSFELLLNELSVKNNLDNSSFLVLN